MLHNTPWPADWPSVTLKIADSSCTILHYGAHIVSCTLNNSQEIFWLSPQSDFTVGKPVRGGNPLCWPNFGVNPNFPDLPKHGIARLMLWEKIEEHQDATQVQAIFSLADSEMQTYKIPEGISLRFSVTLSADTLTTTFEVFNESLHPFEFTESQHAYFSVGDIDKISLGGLQYCSYLDRLTNTEKRNTQEEFHIKKPTDLIFLGHQGPVTINDWGRKRQIHLSKSNAGSVVVWNPYQAMPAEVTDMSEDAFHYFVCVEPTNAQQTPVVVKPNSNSTLTMEIKLKEI